MISELDYGWSSLDSNPGRGHHVVFLGKTLLLAILYPPGCTIGCWQINERSNLTKGRGLTRTKKT